MKKLQMQLKNQKNVLLFLAIILLCGIGLGTYFGISAKDLMENTLSNYILKIGEQSYHFAISHFTILSLLFVLSFIGLGIPAAIAYLFFEGLTIGFCSSIFIGLIGLKGFIFITIFFLLTKVPFLFIYNFFFNKILSITKAIIAWIVYKQNKKDYIINLALGCLILIVLLLLYDLFFDFLGINIIKMISFLLN
ncbi:MAG: hypothetical protein HFI09_04205 [Bacilli bacterium]|nr:hypothetical protein [Bacilli bacterium]